MFIAAGIAILLVYALLVYYIGRSLWKWMSPKPARWLKAAYIIILTVVSTSFILGRFFGGVTILSMIGSYWMALFYVLILLLPLTHLLLWVMKLASLHSHRTEKRAGITVLMLSAAIIGFGIYNAYSPVVRSYEVTIPKAADVESLNIVMAADMHFGLLSGAGHAERMVEEMNRLQPDLVLIPGDVIDDDLEAYLDLGMVELLKGIQSKYGVYTSLGNHDRFDGEITELIAALEQSGMQVLYDETAEVQGITIAGRRDKQDAGRAELSQILSGRDLTAPVLLLDHQPNALDEAQEAGTDLVVSGHTHNGQVFPGNLITGALFENDWGYLQKGSMHSIVTSGYGFWGPPIRLGSRSEIVQIEVTFQP
ncbi:metallophosphoesterase [Paenibacillus sp. F411]|uniref:metallophosphoesterase n=1 Tax=Paenibacillus sp. F411 TaxID=2820239 RepID=UPI001AAF9100|nr:metallophosphoesterase [Paenibacillus sp. F411]MBO2945389.1 metallophosphoesterase [Paenibacillus sp. F411]